MYALQGIVQYGENAMAGKYSHGEEREAEEAKTGYSYLSFYAGGRFVYTTG